MRFTDIAVVGAGPAGIGAALAAARNGASVVLIDENETPGGHLCWTMSHQFGFDGDLEGQRGVEIANWSVDALRAASVELNTQTVAWGLFEDNLLGAASATESFEIRASAVILATGATDIVWPFPGWELPGVMTATAALRMMHLDRVLPGSLVVVIGSGQFADAVTEDIGACGGQVVLHLDFMDGMSAGGHGSVEWIELDGVRTSCDTIVVALGRQPDYQLAQQAQVASAYSQLEGVFVPVRDGTFMSSVPNLYIVGDAAGLGSSARTFAEGAVAGEAASGGAGLADAIERLRAVSSPTVPLPILPSIDDGTVVCRCEEVLCRDIRAAITDGAIGLNDVKRRTRAGMGICQGIYCHRTVSRLIADEANVAIESIVPMTARPPARLISMAAMADAGT